MNIGNLHEIKEVTGNSLDYLTADRVVEILRRDYRVLFSTEEERRLYFDNPTEVLRHLRLTGVNGLKKQKWTKRDLTDFVNNYNNQFASNGKVSLTYRPTYFVAQRL